MVDSKKKIIGWFFIVLGLIILLTPFTPGSILLIIGADMVFGDRPEWIRLKQKVKEFFWK
ncbi:MAG: hypothetical protein A3B91_02705 [Candidatus Yanofskybacteria bacterium RIFCSPHIGHO2_02_FULL_41_29]|uniref:Uncharacterized protein n=1 Tax=Candidatus Yanofskybacteria bacterium RIFCSPHIGHO2_01_FULL_41_53 TaxID=1802663 RepID=A0A1F8ELA7_9BACT|nr:MAG: hypothetical protein A2650_00465 [Candidatus Yanofskybacteria bacterium RIFCSPHIGHO2_01_FULL_41_53]OGN10776.1 MAG: hypothetical protein A3B91_02705 [Candidatus Yanofskybacteria bacterium RIFCSPHIGHO2_02_FULL_41_29]OGN17067.1 MAG: hypothetical protein A3F48_03915 [Candidatus Yanofskybacteria bacterium RIFCSPHIGHO2_12_FULL_41_9]OGN21797.1 MAG: hypothetical protein A2916_01270 [Candidatus Yanofskybacteria bacterium RIFCSPLOWO2_01_FULL_41_67]OGN29411.1 MAG: hypothetical protein A3H54_04105 